MIKAKQVKVEVGTNPKEKKSDVIYFKSFDEMNKVLSPSRILIIEAIREHDPESVYELAKILKKDQANLSKDIKVLEKWGFIDIVKNKDGERIRTKPETDYDLIEMTIKLGAGMLVAAKEVLDDVGDELRGEKGTENREYVKKKFKEVQNKGKVSGKKIVNPARKNIRKISRRVAKKIVDLSKEED